VRSECQPSRQRACRQTEVAAGILTVGTSSATALFPSPAGRERLPLVRPALPHPRRQVASTLIHRSNYTAGRRPRPLVHMSGTAVTLSSSQLNHQPSRFLLAFNSARSARQNFLHFGRHPYKGTRSSVRNQLRRGNKRTLRHCEPHSITKLRHIPNGNGPLVTERALCLR
jgi:hypothetical protein